MDSYRVKLKHISLHVIELKSMNNFYGYYVIRSTLTWLHLNVATVNNYFNLCVKTVRWLEGFLYLPYCISSLAYNNILQCFSSIWLIGFRFLNFSYPCLFAHSGDQYILCCVFGLFLFSSCMLPVRLDCPFLISPFDIL